MSRTDSEFTCEVVRVVSVEKHPNANRLEVVKFQFADGTVPEYQVVSGLNEFAPGDLAVYISDDSMVPVSDPSFEFLKKRLDYKGTTHYRVKAANLRGVVSTGLLFSPPGESYKLGTDVAGLFGVIKYVRPEDAERFSEAAPLVGSSRPGNRIRRWLASFWKQQPNVIKTIPEYSVLSLRKIPGLFHTDEQVVFTEKIHGSNIRFGRVAGKSYVGSHRCTKSDHRNWFARLLAPRKTSSYYGDDIFSCWFNETFTKIEQKQLPDNIVFYGEIFGVTPSGKKVQDLTYGRNRLSVVVFDAYDVLARRWCTQLEVSDLMPKHLNFPPVNYIGPFDMDLLRTLAESDSMMCDNHLSEGIVVRSLDGSKAGKWVSNRYLTRKGE